MLLGNKIAAIERISGWHFWLRYVNGQRVYLNLADIAEEAQKAEGGYLHPFKDAAYFEQAALDDGTLVWPNGYDMCPDYLYLRGQVLLENDLGQHAA